MRHDYLKIDSMYKTEVEQMKSLLIANTVIATKQQAKDLIRKLNSYFEESRCIEMALVIDDYTEKLVNAGFLTWEEAEQAAF